MHCECDMSILRVRAINWRIVIVNDIQFKKLWTTVLRKISSLLIDFNFQVVGLEILL